MIDLQALSSFIHRARQASYAAEPDYDPKSQREQREYGWEWQGWQYSDLCLAESGDGNVIGRELVTYSGELIWCTTYYGVIVHPDVDRLKLYTFLRQAMRAVDQKSLPARAQNKFVNGDYVYGCDLSGTLLEFSGVERVWLKGAPVYRLYFNGGLMKSRL